MQLDTERLTLREVEWSDLHNIHSLHSLPAVDEFNTLGIPADVKETEQVLAPIIDDRHANPRRKYGWAIVERSSNTFVGLIGMNLSADRFRMGEIYFKLMPVSWGKGYATEAAKAVIRFGFEQLQLHRIEAGVATENKASIRVLEKLGMTREGMRRKILPIRGQWKDNYHYALLEDDASCDD
jgi:ribosomal-protein-alanine N-acetyltransferase